MTIEKIRYFIEVARSSSITQAAKNLYVSQPNLSKQLAQMEAECGFPLFSRTKHRLELTEAGAELYEQLQNIPETVDAAFAHAKEVSERSARHLSVGVMELQEMSEMLMPAITEFSRQHPGVDVNLERNGFSKLRAGLDNGVYDMIVTMAFDAQDPQDYEKLVLSEPLPMIAVHKDTPLAKRKSISFKELKNESFVLIASRETPQGERQFMNECANAGFCPKLVRRPSSLESLLLCVEAGIGIALLDNNIRLDPITPVRLVPVNDIPSICFTAVWSKKCCSPMLAEFLPILRASAQGK
ncbi:MAG: LysR family transcriptional regulator [Eubacterium sp.]|nr:LysR family transcriptional regulator [Eubacterium sp.]